MAQFTTSEQSMANGASKVDEASTQITQVLSKLGSEVDQLRSGWRGQGANSFMQVHEAFGQQANKINTALKNMHDALVSNKTTYATQESDQSQSFSTLAQNING